MRIRVVQASVIPGLPVDTPGLDIVDVGILAHHVASGDALIFYESSDDFVNCDTIAIGEVVSTYPERQQIAVDLRSHRVTIQPDSHARHRWRNSPYLCLDTKKVAKYGLVEHLADAFADPSWHTRRLQDCIAHVFRPNIDIPTLQPVAGFIYLFRSPFLYKIGKSTDPDRRRLEVEKDIGADVEIIHVIPSTDYMRSEVTLHKQFATRRKWGEWFALNDDDVLEICSITRFEY